MGQILWKGVSQVSGLGRPSEQMATPDSRLALRCRGGCRPPHVWNTEVEKDFFAWGGRPLQSFQIHSRNVFPLMNNWFVYIAVCNFPKIMVTIVTIIFEKFLKPKMDRFRSLKGFFGGIFFVFQPGIYIDRWDLPKTALNLVNLGP